MGNVYQRSYFPTGYEAWLTESHIMSNSGQPFTEQNYSNYFNEESKQYIRIVSDKYAKKEREVRENYEKFLKNEYKREHILDANDKLISEKGAEYELLIKEHPEKSKEYESEFIAFVDELTSQEKLDACPDPEHDKVFELASRKIYDVLVGHKLCIFWLKAIEQPYENAYSFFNSEERPTAEDLFYQVEAEYNLPYSAAEMISVYKYYT